MKIRRVVARTIADGVTGELYSGRVTAVNGSITQVEKGVFEPQAGDIVVIKYNNDFYFLKRIVAVAGDVVEFREGKLYVNGQLREEPYVKLECHWNMKPVTVEVGNYYVVGDNRSMPIGKHQHGSVRARRIIGKPLF